MQKVRKYSLLVVFLLVGIQLLLVSAWVPKADTQISVFWVVSILISLLLAAVGFLAADRVKAINNRLSDTSRRIETLSGTLASVNLNLTENTSQLKAQTGNMNEQLQKVTEAQKGYNKCLADVKKTLEGHRQCLRYHIREHSRCKDCLVSQDHIDDK